MNDSGHSSRTGSAVAPLRLAIIGFGKIARDQHWPAVDASEQIELVATVDRDGRGLGDVPFFPTVDTLASSGIPVDAVAICTPPQVRYPVARQALRQGWHVLLEKPPGTTLAEVDALYDQARGAGKTLFAAWHSRFAAGVEHARNWLAGQQIQRARVVWRENVRVWHPGQTWIWQPGGFGVFDPGINALSILTQILPDPIFVRESRLSVPENQAAPIAANMTLEDSSANPVIVHLDFREEGPQQWDIVVETVAGVVTLSAGGADMSIDGVRLPIKGNGEHTEYDALYHRFVDLVRAGRSEVDVAPLRLVADAFFKGRFETVEPFHE
ncbi:Gfo/Idh/MocA family protein [Qipengyuania sp.]|uniref:Gfo/Idh/MocA family protein n=1 Tax=Qipengyuania sp. TaxID=2004515 RepID=UPI003AF57153